MKGIDEFLGAAVDLSDIDDSDDDDNDGDEDDADAGGAPQDLVPRPQSPTVKRRGAPKEGPVQKKKKLAPGSLVVPQEAAVKFASDLLASSLPTISREDSRPVKVSGDTEVPTSLSAESVEQTATQPLGSETVYFWKQ